ncbi:hypothetical protein FF38_10729 [Lucilia cuprina]|uniref:Uncharacterized protein n=1 Tax=Lucilia cuprina TaxID=7375 RepID=A0A0L0BT90_LUCCU|nr:hypothetical protein FF38_10729 [Lucilia cuprina]
MNICTLGIKKGWKILSDTGSTSASSTEANRSPMGGLNSSSDDSNCSNQTTHSMVTSAASPPNSLIKIETSPITSNASGHNNTTNTNHQQHQHQPHNETMKFITTPQMAEITLQKLRQRFSNSTPLTSSSAESAMRSLELVRIAVQSAFDKEIDEMVKHFIETYFKPAFSNIKENLGQGAINDDALQKMSCALLENAKSQYKILRYKPQLSTTSNSITTLPNISEISTMRMALKRPAVNKPTSTVMEMQKRFFPDNMILKQTVQQTQQPQTPVLPSVGTIKSSLAHNHHSTTVVQHHQSQLQQPAINAVEVQQLQTQQQQPHPRRQIFWNTANISTSTKFVLDVQANQAFGFSAEGKERLASKHPELIRYLPDTEDRDWLTNQRIIPQQNRNSRFLFLIYDEVCHLYQNHDIYKKKVSIDLSLMMTFTVPDFMIQKMKVFFVDLNIKSRGLITNSYSIAGATTAKLHQPHQQTNSHLRNALLLGTQQTLVASTTTTSIVATTSDAASSSVIASSSSSAPLASSSTNNITSTETLLQQKSKSSNLSSSHATLTALLNNSSSTSMNSTAINEKSVNSSPSSTPTLLNKLRK